MEEKLVTLAIHTFQKAQMLKMFLESEGIDVYLHNINLIQPVVSAGVRVRIKESDLPLALKLIEENPDFKEDSLGSDEAPQILIPVDFSEYSIQACEIGFKYASEIGVEITLLHSYITYRFNPLGLNEMFALPDAKKRISEDILAEKQAQRNINKLERFIQEKINTKEWPAVNFSSEIDSGLPEDQILAYTKKHPVCLIIMGTRGKDKKDVDLIGSVTAEVINQTKIPVLAIPENTPFRDLSEIKNIAFGTSFDQKDLIAVDSLIKMFMPFKINYHLFHLSHKPDAWTEIKLAGLKEYFAKQYPTIVFHYEIIDANDFLINMEHYIKEKGIDIISLATHKRNLFTRLFNPGVSHKMLFHTDTPLLAFYS